MKACWKSEDGLYLDLLHKLLKRLQEFTFTVKDVVYFVCRWFLFSLELWRLVVAAINREPFLDLVVLGYLEF